MFTPNIRRQHRESGQALIEFVFVGIFMLLLVFGLVDFGRALMMRQILVAVSREGANLASRGTSLEDTINAVSISAQPLNLLTNGYVIVTAVQRQSNGALRIADQRKAGALPHPSRVGNTIGGPATLPPTSAEVPPRGRTLYVVEVTHRYTPITPIGRLLGTVLPTQLTDVAYF
ncbi:MAG: pilus assembly protein [Verrucomicrobiae bacterium]|nr:pilus assembly protein [Verrucomicrobiae bacterium]MDW8343227.1 pilus assembly protein [Verrucomicrobiae bacterium]